MPKIPDMSKVRLSPLRIPFGWFRLTASQVIKPTDLWLTEDSSRLRGERVEQWCAATDSDIGKKVKDRTQFYKGGSLYVYIRKHQNQTQYENSKRS